MKSKSFIIVASLLFVASAASLVAAQNPDKSADGGNDYGSITNYLDLYNSIVKELNMYYVDTIDAKKVATTSLRLRLPRNSSKKRVMPCSLRCRIISRALLSTG